ncbi:histidinol dehydrogenase [Luteibaculum oceani]|uniref:Histidinol dehydrogenase n=1 Tax=Luteibaculum oceani TaxID=1294296 RepID=A0A5C6VAE5_9FLAO|nr:histidinol dehydrogenase [Luteibaculum oceani]TXC81481.1 histidinol dehydrogenase [Luteibaculum oceani]
MLAIYKEPQIDSWSSLCQRPSVDAANLEELINQIFQSVKSKGDQALLDYARMFEASVPSKFLMDAITWDKLAKECGADLQNAIKHAAKNIEKFHRAQKTPEAVITVEPGVECWQKPVPIERVAIYIPGGTAPLFSTVLMLAIPAKIAGVGEINLFTPPNKEKSIHPAIAYAAKLAGVSNIYTVGGAQAVAAATYGTESIPKCDKIFGPGNQYVTAAKMKAQQVGVAIDMPAGPSELLVWADENSNAAFIASDLLSQAEHGMDSQVVLVTNSEQKVAEVKAELEIQLRTLPREGIASGALKNSFAVIFKDSKKSVDFVNTYAPEHLIISTMDAMELSEKVRNAGSVFIGEYSPESVGDYASGTNHTLPTSGFSRAYSGVNLDSYFRKITFQKLSKEGLGNLSSTVICMAENEGLQAHANAVKIRLQ